LQRTPLYRTCTAAPPFEQSGSSVVATVKLSGIVRGEIKTGRHGKAGGEGVGACHAIVGAQVLISSPRPSIVVASSQSDVLRRRMASVVVTHD
jgi:hypothetical protein